MMPTQQVARGGPSGRVPRRAGSALSWGTSVHIGAYTRSAQSETANDSPPTLLSSESRTRGSRHGLSRRRIPPGAGARRPGDGAVVMLAFVKPELLSRWIDEVRVRAVRQAVATAAVPRRSPGCARGRLAAPAGVSAIGTGVRLKDSAPGPVAGCRSPERRKSSACSHPGSQNSQVRSDRTPAQQTQRWLPASWTAMPLRGSVRACGRSSTRPTLPVRRYRARR